METELTLKVPPSALERVRSHPMLAERAQGGGRNLECQFGFHASSFPG